MYLLPWNVADRKAVLVRSAHLTAPVAFSCNEQHVCDGDVKIAGSRGTDTGCILPMGFRQVTRCPVELGAPACSYLQHQPHGLETVIERPAGRIHGGSILERGFRFGLDVS